MFEKENKSKRLDYLDNLPESLKEFIKDTKSIDDSRKLEKLTSMSDDSFDYNDYKDFKNKINIAKNIEILNINQKVTEDKTQDVKYNLKSNNKLKKINKNQIQKFKKNNLKKNPKKFSDNFQNNDEQIEISYDDIEYQGEIELNHNYENANYFDDKNIETNNNDIEDVDYNDENYFDDYKEEDFIYEEERNFYKNNKQINKINFNGMV